MAARKKYDLAVKSGTYPAVVNGRPKDKARYENIGCMMENDDGSQFLLLKRCINLAAFPTRNNDDDMVVVSRFEVRDQNDQQAPYYGDPNYQPAPQYDYHPHAPQPVQHSQQPAPMPQQGYPQQHHQHAPQPVPHSQQPAPAAQHRQ